MPFFLTKIGDLGPAALELVKATSKLFDSVGEPLKTVLQAKANSSAKITKLKTEIDLAEMRQRAANRVELEQLQHQQNLEAIVGAALPKVKESDSSEASKAISEDWIDNFSQRARHVSNKQMQDLWSRLLAGEATAPGTFAKRTVNFLAEMETADAEQFSLLCRFVWKFNGSCGPLVFWGVEKHPEIYLANGLNFETLNHLGNLGLIKAEITFFSVGFCLTPPASESIIARYHGDQLTLNPKPGDEKETNWKLPVGNVLFTEVGRQLSSLCKADPLPGFFEFVVERWQDYLQSAAAEPNSNDGLV